MAETEQFIASIQVGDSANKFGSGSVRVDATDARAYIAAANAGARDATKVGLLLAAMLGMSAADGTTGWKKKSVECNFISDAYAPTNVDGLYNSNKWKVTGLTTNNGLPVSDSFYIPQYLVTGVVMESDGVSADLTDPPASDLVTQVLDTAISKYGTAFTSVISIQRNDS